MKALLARISVPGVIAAALFSGLLVTAASPAHANAQNCRKYIEGRGYTVSEERAKICGGRYLGEFGHERCVELMVATLLPRDVADMACRWANERP
jgi:hypothetical protein